MENKDLDLKLLTKTLFELMGFSTHFEVKLRSKSYVQTYKTHDISDIDVYGYKFLGDLSLNTVGAECKSGESNALEEAFKFMGIVDYFNIGTGYLMKSKIHQNAREISAKNNFRCFSEAELRKLLLGFSIDIDKNIKIEHAKFRRHQDSMKALKIANEKLHDYINLDYWNKENWRNIHNIVHLIHRKEAQLSLFSKEVSEVSIKHAYYYVLELFSFSLLKNISNAMMINYSDVDNSIVISLFGGAESLHERRRIADMVNIATGESLSLEPEWQSAFVTISSRLALSPFAAAQIPTLIQDIRENCFYDKKISITSATLKKYPDLTRKFAQDIVQFLVLASGVDTTVYSELMAL
ncbi:hypothetical protein [Pseudoflavitalea rhizosphaerae]|uniref:hypothetical protein n=1 Tax=Pseudoflavitalea rhizosphaerae TaxID=1884793 RepID=UPI000F8E2D13|nr:hypothetical protein [Pseudoflavitalea rhizosphaerae]